MYVVKHRSCGHFAGVGQSRDAAEKTKQTLEAAGNHGWRVQTVGEADLPAVVEAVASGEMCGTCEFTLPDNVKLTAEGIVTGHGIRYEGTAKAHAQIPDPGPGEHLWIVIASHRVTPVEGGRYNLDHENLLSVDGPVCFKCELGCTPAVAASPCDGSVDA